MSKPYFSFERFWRSVLIDAQLAECLDAIKSARGLERWFIGHAEYTDRDANEHAIGGDTYRWKWLNKALEFTGRVLHADDASLVFTFGDAGNVRMSCKQDGERVRVTIRQEALPDTPYPQDAWINCYVCWSFFLLNLKSVLEHGIDLRERDVQEDELVNF